jgi:hypothetical protein
MKEADRGATCTLSRLHDEISHTGKQKTSFIVEQQLWKKWILFVVNKRGSARKLSEELEEALKEYMRNHRKSN